LNTTKDKRENRRSRESENGSESGSYLRKRRVYPVEVHCMAKVFRRSTKPAVCTRQKMGVGLPVSKISAARNKLLH